MQSAILTALPMVHMTALSVGAAFLGGYGLYAQQKLMEAADELDQSLQDAESYGPPQLVIKADVSDVLQSDGSLNWARARQVLWGSIAMMQGPAPEYDGMSIITSCKRLCQILYLLSVTPPFSLRAGAATQAAVGEFDVNRLNELRRRLRFLTYTWNTARQELLRLGEVTTELEPKQLEHEASRQKALTDEERAILRAPFMSVNYAAVIEQLFEHFVTFEAKVMPALEKNVRLRDLYRNRFQLARSARTAFWAAVYVLTVGVFIPLLLQSLSIDFKYELRAEPYALLVLSFGPYAWIATVCFARISRLA